MHTIEVDFQVLKELMLRRETESVTFNDVIRRLLKLDPAARPSEPKRPGPSRDDWTTKGVTFPSGTEFRAIYKGAEHRGRVETGALVVNGKRYHSPSAAAVAITGNSVNGWIFWECRLPAQTQWQLISGLRKSA